MTISLLAIAKYTYDRYLVIFIKLMLPSMVLSLLYDKGIYLPDAINHAIQFSTILALCAWCLSSLRTTKQFTFSLLIGILIIISVGCSFNQVEGWSLLWLILCAVMSLKLYFARHYICQEISFRESAYIIHEFSDGRGYFVTEEKMGFNGYYRELVDFTATRGQSHCVFKNMDEAKLAVSMLDDHQGRSRESVAS